jgi:hypothetical protein
MNYSGKNEFKELLARCFGDMALSILEDPNAMILKCSLEGLNAFMNGLSGHVMNAAVESEDERDYDALVALKGTYDKVIANLEYFKDGELSRYARKYLEDNHVNLSSENGARDFANFEDCMKRHKKDFLNFEFAVEDFLIPDIIHVFLDDTMGMFVEEQEAAVFGAVMPRTA